MAFQLEINVHLNHLVPFHRNPLKVIVNSTSVNKINKITGFTPASFHFRLPKLSPGSQKPQESIKSLARWLSPPANRPGMRLFTGRAVTKVGLLLTSVYLSAPNRSRYFALICLFFADTYRRVTRLDIYLWNQAL